MVSDLHHKILPIRFNIAEYLRLPTSPLHHKGGCQERTAPEKQWRTNITTDDTRPILQAILVGTSTSLQTTPAAVDSRVGMQVTNVRT